MTAEPNIATIPDAVKPKWTKGPWDLSDIGEYGDWDGNSRVVAADDIRICAVHAGGDAEMSAENEANAHLIAAAPDLYKMLDRLLDEYAYDGKADISIWNDVHNVMARARGEVS